MTRIYRETADLKDLVCKTMVSVVNDSDKEIIFTTTGGERYMLYHDQDCCEEVSIEDICGDLQDLVGSPILLAEESTNNDEPKQYDHDLFLWTFYKFATINGHVDIRWYGESNGYYSVAVSFARIVAE